MVYKKVDLDKVRLQAADIHLLVMDVDGVLTDGHLPFDGQGRECKVFHVRDGYGIRRVIDAGLEVALISGRNSIPVKKRADELGIRHVFLGVKEKLATLQKLAEKLGIRGTPAIILSNGLVISGSKDADSLIALIDKSS